ncbi:hypothetical protein SAMCFNEI73_pB0246 (plasmid) [Sinorhizobium americanum]|uniref:Uncharacterized protein n=1 Tax=Sinorhizobium americanum TaxID=194963 RepID=A0A1L3LTQ3_9HYPH|nr:hypothetical protein SAMCFNEI73_pB0246 [Sinorhizobium americanum]
MCIRNLAAIRHFHRLLQRSEILVSFELYVRDVAFTIRAGVDYLPWCHIPSPDLS